ncbi:MAG: hypothetical protein ALECFALPRED_001757 [Alectoria fallacina]|uniref:Haloacid dehalogenase n=1 Tax=Alectoria fallacina TaxID=1903189 RepID=A0A8H3IJP3_9LECA|nr:MAG: hypothetical protein ALECFALPRED_001757 [Alectoria fallacina]
MSPSGQKSQPKALLFDASPDLPPFYTQSNPTQVFGTVVDWRTSVTKYLERRSFESLNSGSSSIATAVRMKCAQVDWPTFVQEWRSSYYEFTRDQAKRKDNGQPLAFKTVDDHHLDSLRALLDQAGISGLWTDDQVIQVSRVWRHLEGWPDSSPGLVALKDKGFIICTLSNGNVELLTDMVAHAGLPWTRIFSAEKFGAYKPHPSVYTSACKELGLEPCQCAMVAAHLADLDAARECGLQTIYIERTQEETWPADKIDGAKSKGWADMWVTIDDDTVGGGILEVARNLEGEQKP